MPRGRPRRNLKTKTQSNHANGGANDNLNTEFSETENRPEDNIGDPIEIQTADEEENSSSDENNSDSSSSEIPRKRKLTEGKIDVDEELESADDEELTDSDLDDEYYVEGLDGDDSSRNDVPTDLPLSFCGPSEKAAETCRLPARRITADESSMFPFLEDNENVSLRPAYLIARNAACHMWTEDPTVQVTTDRLMGYVVSSSNDQAVLCMHAAGLTASLPASEDASPITSVWSTPVARQNLERLAYLAVLFLERYGYINIGAFKQLAAPLTRAVKPTSGDSTTSTTRRGADKHAANATIPLKVIICGAGAAGLMAARQLVYFGAQVTVFEARDRIGGRIWTYKQGNQFADLGAMIITGMSGNPSTILAKQGGLMLAPINPCCTLYAASGRPVSQEKDARIEKEFNRILATAGHIAVKDPENLAGKSLGQVIEDLIRFQEHRIIPLKISHRNLVSILLRRKAKILNEFSSDCGDFASANAKVMHPLPSNATAIDSSLSTISSMADARREINEAYNDWQALCKESHETPSPPAPPSSLTARSRRSRVVVETASTISVSSTNSSASATPHVASPTKHDSDAGEVSKLSGVVDVQDEYNRRRQLSMLHAAWKRFDPMQVALTKINRQLEVLAQNPPRDVYLTSSERNLIDWHLANLEFANATELQNLSLIHWDQDDAYELGGDHCIVQGGFGQIMDVLTCSSGASGTLRPAVDNPCGQIELKSSIKEISISDSGVKVSCLNKAVSEDELISHYGDVVLCALPLGVLKESVKISNAEKKLEQADLTTLSAPYFIPPLPPWKCEAIERTGFGTLNKLVLFFNDFFWDRNERVFGYVHDSTERRGELFLFWSITDRPCLIALVAGKAAVTLETEIAATVGPKGDDDTAAYLKLPIVARALSILRKIFGRQHMGNVPDPIGAYATRWTSDENIRGSYSYVAVGSSGDDYDFLAAPASQVAPTLPSSLSAPAAATGGEEGSPQVPLRLFFCGEHTNRHYPASVQGAVFSGLREVARIANTFCPGETPIRQHGFVLRQAPSVTQQQQPMAM
ncbi:lysine specific histone demethylase 1A [Echinococcus multilocularis]|uniref:Lysine specific histone demethylase 1A n=1 Tax=Echinococcus multilocularis TaxID=6211 RepID=A0A087VY39_ECHMU|nr:lysine specific histone demethylase 1A [Echinococcus multilocularis]